MRIPGVALTGLVLAAVLMVGAALADIKTFNAAVKTGDYRTAAAEAREIWKTWDNSRADTAVVAREFGFSAYIGGDYAGAKEYGQFLKDYGASLPTPDEQPAVSRMLLAAAENRLAANGGTRQALFEALKAREGSRGVDMQSVVASDALYRGDWSSGDWNGARQSSELAHALISRGGDRLAPRALHAKAISATSGFLTGRDRHDYEEIVEAHDAVVDAMDNAVEPKVRQELIPLKFQLQAWASSVHAHFDASPQTGSLIPKNVKRIPLKETQLPIFENRYVGPDACRGDLETIGLRYPQNAEFRGMVGTVILKFDTDAQGKLSNTEVLAAVPVA